MKFSAQIITYFIKVSFIRWKHGSLVDTLTQYFQFIIFIRTEYSKIYLKVALYALVAQLVVYRKA